jgi:hypothetical protein
LLRSIGAVSDDLSLFGDDAPSVPVKPAPTLTTIADWQIDLLRKALDARGLVTMADRQHAVESAAGRAVESLRALTHDEAMRVLTQLGQAPASDRRTTSAWDDRDEDTWIDRL